MESVFKPVGLWQACFEAGFEDAMLDRLVGKRTSPDEFLSNLYIFPAKSLFILLVLLIGLIG